MTANTKSKLSQRVFIGIKVSNEIAKACAKLQTEFSDLPARFMPPNGIHLTLLLPWETTDQSSAENALRQAIRLIKKFTLKLNRLTYGPDNIKPRFVWIECEASEVLIELKKSLLEAFGVAEHMPFLPHITIARFSDKDRSLTKWRPIERPLELSMLVESVELFASPRGSGGKYRVLASLPLHH